MTLFYHTSSGQTHTYTDYSSDDLNLTVRTARPSRLSPSPTSPTGRTTFISSLRNRLHPDSRPQTGTSGSRTSRTSQAPESCPLHPPSSCPRQRITSNSLGLEIPPHRSCVRGRIPVHPPSPFAITSPHSAQYSTSSSSPRLRTNARMAPHQVSPSRQPMMHPILAHDISYESRHTSNVISHGGITRYPRIAITDIPVAYPSESSSRAQAIQEQRLEIGLARAARQDGRTERRERARSQGDAAAVIPAQTQWTRRPRAERRDEEAGDDAPPPPYAEQDTSSVFGGARVEHVLVGLGRRETGTLPPRYGDVTRRD